MSWRIDFRYDLNVSLLGMQEDFYIVGASVEFWLSINGISDLWQQTYNFLWIMTPPSTDLHRQKGYC